MSGWPLHCVIDVEEALAGSLSPYFSLMVVRARWSGVEAYFDSGGLAFHTPVNVCVMAGMYRGLLGMGGVPDGAGVHDGSLMVYPFHPVQSLMAAYILLPYNNMMVLVRTDSTAF